MPTEALILSLAMAVMRSATERIPTRSFSSTTGRLIRWSPPRRMGNFLPERILRRPF
jgi:hypothetical protein